MPEYTINQGDCLMNLARERGYFWQTLWDHPENARLKEERGNPNVLHPGDRLFVPEKELKQETCGSDRRHRFRRKGWPAKLRLRIVQPPAEEAPSDEGRPEQAAGSQETSFEGGDPDPAAAPPEPEPRRNTPYTIEIDGVLSSGQTDGDGLLEISMPDNARRGRLIIDPGTDQEEIIPLNLGHINPSSAISGVKQRLANLMLYCGPIDEQESDDLTNALRRFQEMNDLEVTGRSDAATRDRLVQEHGC